MEKLAKAIPWFFVGLALGILSFLLIGCQDWPVEKELTGVVTMVGNEPFTDLAIITATDQIYVLKCNEYDKNALQRMQGVQIIACYTNTQPSTNGRTINVIRYKLGG